MFPTYLIRRFWWLPFGKVPEISATALKQRIGEPVPPLLIDVRTRAEWQKNHIADSVSIPITELHRRLPEKNFDPKRPIVTICLSAHRSIPAVRLLQREGMNNVTQLAGGMLAWWRAGLPTTKKS